MERMAMIGFAPRALVVAVALGLAAHGAHAATQVVSFNVLNASATVVAPLLAGDSLVLDTLVTTEVGSLLQTINFTVGAGVAALSGQAAWEVTTATGPGPRLVGVNIDIFNAANVLVTSDSFAGTLGGFAVSTFASAIAPGSYRLVATGTGVRESSLDLALSFIPIPEPPVAGLMLAGLAVVGFLSARRRS